MLMLDSMLPVFSARMGRGVPEMVLVLVPRASSPNSMALLVKVKERREFMVKLERLLLELGPSRVAPLDQSPYPVLSLARIRQ